MKKKILSICKSGEGFGELSLIDGKPRSASAQTLENCVLLTLTAQSFFDLLRTHFDITLGIMQELSNRLRDTKEKQILTISSSDFKLDLAKLR